MNTSKVKNSTTSSTSTAFLQGILDKLPLMIAWKNSESVYLGCNRKFAQLVGVNEPENIIGKRDADFPWLSHPEQSDSDLDRQVIETGHPIYHRLHSRVLSGSEPVWIDENRIPIVDETNNVQGILWAFEDVAGYLPDEDHKSHTRKALEMAVANRSSRLVGIADFDNFIEETLQEIQKIVRARHSLICNVQAGKPIPEILYGESSNEKNAGTEYLREFAKPTVYEQLKNNLEVVICDCAQSDDWINSSFLRSCLDIEKAHAFPLLVNENDLLIWVLAGANKSAEIISRHNSLLSVFAEILSISFERRKNEEFLRRIERSFSSTSQGIAIANAQGVIEYVNEAWCALHGFECKKPVGGSLDSIFSNPEQWDFKKALQTIEEKGMLETEMKQCKPNGTTLIVQETFSFTKGDNEAEASILNISRDITQKKQIELEREKLQTQLRQAQKMEALGRLTGEVAHDFNNLLLGIIGNTDLAMIEIEPDSIVYDNLIEARLCADRATSLIRQLMKFCKQRVDDKKIINLNELLDNLGNLLKTLLGENIDFTIKEFEHPLYVEAEWVQIEQVIINLIANARDAMPHGGNLIIEIDKVILRESMVEYSLIAEPGEYVRMTVSDTGHGMNEDTRSKIFEPFFSTKSKELGTGLGLATIYGIVKQHGGYIEVYTELDVGSTFKVYLPRVDDESDSLSHTFRAEIPQGGHERIMFVEDDPNICKLNEKLLTRLGYCVHGFSSPKDAIAFFKTTPLPVDLLITDMIMPVMNGNELAKTIQAEHPNIKTIFTSGYTNNHLLVTGLISPNYAFIEKPYTLEELSKAIREVLDGAKSSCPVRNEH